MLTPGANAQVQNGRLITTIIYTPVPGVDLDLFAFALSSNGKVRGDADLCFHGQPRIQGGALQQTKAGEHETVFTLDLDRLDFLVEKVAVAAALSQNKASFGAVQRLEMMISGDLHAPIPTQGMNETALILGEFYRYKGQWKFRCVAQGFAGGSEPLARHFGVSPGLLSKPKAQLDVPPRPKPISTLEPSHGAPTQERNQPRINLNKITLDKHQSTISLKKDDGNFGEIKINLKWNQGRPQAKGIFGSLFGAKAGGIDLDVGCLFELKNGQKGAVQALGNAFGDFRSAPYIQLMGDDRTGESVDGEWLRINGQHWSNIKRVLIYAFIYEGAPNWQATDGVVTLYVPGQPPIEVRVSEEGGSKGMCSIALLENKGGSVNVSREVRFFNGHNEMDHRFGWGLRWVAGSK